MAPGDTKPSTALETARWEAILGTAFDAIISIDQRSTITLFNRAAESIFGYAAAEVVGGPVEVLMPPPYGAEHREYVRRYEETGIPRAIGRIRKVEARRKNGEVFPIELSVSRAQVGDGIIYSAIIRDVSVQTQLEEELRAHGRREGALARLGLAALDEDLSRIFDEACTLARAVLAVDLAVVLLLAGDGTVVVRGAEGCRHPVGTTLPAMRLPVDVRLALPAELGETACVAGLSVPIGSSGHPIGMLVIGARSPTRFPLDTVHFVQSITNVLAEAVGRAHAEDEQERLLRRALQRERLADIGTLTAKVLHDLGNPLAGLAMTAQSILRRIERAPEEPVAAIRPGVERIVATMQRLDTLLSEFKGFAREHDLAFRAQPLRTLLAGVIVNWEPEASQRQVDLVLGACPEVLVRVDADQMHRVFDNVLKNALEAIDRGPGVVEIAAEHRGDDRVVLTIRDSGPGLPAGLDPFALFATTKRDGTGLGLPTCRQIVEAHGGHVTAASRAAHGTTITIELPRATRP